MNKFLTGMILSVAVAAPAAAADLPVRAAPVYTPPPGPVAVFTWTGCFIGGNAGGHFGRDNITSTTNPIPSGATAAAQIDAQSPVTLSPTGFIGGGQIGCNLASYAFVVGFEGDIQWVSGSDSRTVVFTGTPIAYQMFNETKNSWLSTVRARVGWAAGPALFYATGGFAFGGLKTTDSFSVGGVIATVDTSKTRMGWTAGGGIEFAFALRWTARVEYLYVDLLDFDVSIPCQVDCLGQATDTVINHHYRDHIIRAALNYKFY